MHKKYLKNCVFKIFSVGHGSFGEFRLKFSEIPRLLSFRRCSLNYCRNFLRIEKATTEPQAFET
jgi:hypothetical protein